MKMYKLFFVVLIALSCNSNKRKNQKIGEGKLDSIKEVVKVVSNNAIDSSKFRHDFYTAMVFVDSVYNIGKHKKIKINSKDDLEYIFKLNLSELKKFTALQQFVYLVFYKDMYAQNCFILGRPNWKQVLNKIHLRLPNANYKTGNESMLSDEYKYYLTTQLPHSDSLFKHAMFYLRNDSTVTTILNCANVCYKKKCFYWYLEGLQKYNCPIFATAAIDNYAQQNIDKFNAQFAPSIFGQISNAYENYPLICVKSTQNKLDLIQNYIRRWVGN